MMFKKLSLAAALLGSSMVSGFAPSNNNNKLFGVSSQRTTSSTPLSMVAIDTSDIKNGLTVELDGEPYKVLSFSIMKQARGAAKTTIKFKNLMRGTTIENTYRSGEKFETAMVEKKKAQFTYPDENGNFFFMDMETFDEVMIEAPLVEDVKEWITEGLECDLITFKEKCIEVKVPNPMIYEVVDTEPSIKGSTVNALTKPAVLESGATVTVPGFVEIGTRIKVDTEKREYLERAKE